MGWIKSKVKSTPRGSKKGSAAKEAEAAAAQKEKEEAAALKVQSLSRGNSGRKVSQTKKEEKQTKEEQDAVTKMQAAARGGQARRMSATLKGKEELPSATEDDQQLDAGSVADSNGWPVVAAKCRQARGEFLHVDAVPRAAVNAARALCLSPSFERSLHGCACLYLRCSVQVLE